MSSSKFVAVSQFLSSRILVTLGNLIDIPSAVWVVDLLNSAPVISQTGARYNDGYKNRYGRGEIWYVARLSEVGVARLR